MSDSLVTRYLTLGLGLGRHVEDYVDAYYGPADLKERIASSPPPAPSVLADDSERLLADVRSASELDAARRRWLEAQVAALHAVARKLRGDELAYADEVELCYGVRPRRYPEEQFERAHQALDEVLPGAEALADRWAAYLEATSVPGDAVAMAMPSLAAELRERCEQLFGLPEGERIEFEFVRDEPWAAFNYYLGGRRSRIAVNMDVPIPAQFVAELVAHEAYPGHHTEHATKEQRLVDERGLGEQRIIMTPSPESVVSEGIAELAVDVALGDDAEAVAAEHLRAAGVEYDHEVGAAVREAREALGVIGANAAWLVHQEGVPLDEVRAYVQRWSLHPPKRVEQVLRFVTDPTWSAYVYCYGEGRRLARSFVDGDPKRFSRLLNEQLTPADLAGD